MTKLPIKTRIALWFLERRLAAAIKKGLKMNPLPKWIGWLSMLGTIGTALSTIGGILPPKIGAAIAAVGVILSNLSHSLPGTGGKQ